VVRQASCCLLASTRFEPRGPLTRHPRKATRDRASPFFTYETFTLPYRQCLYRCWPLIDIARDISRLTRREIRGGIGDKRAFTWTLRVKRARYCYRRDHRSSSYRSALMRRLIGRATGDASATIIKANCGPNVRNRDRKRSL
jgi:hypothetical protein